jgi:hypothetical protein
MLIPDFSFTAMVLKYLPDGWMCTPMPYDYGEDDKRKVFLLICLLLLILVEIVAISLHKRKANNEAAIRGLC